MCDGAENGMIYTQNGVIIYRITLCDSTKNDTICTQNEVLFDRITQCVMIRKKIQKLKNLRCVIPHDYYRSATTMSESLEV